MLIEFRKGVQCVSVFIVTMSKELRKSFPYLQILTKTNPKISVKLYKQILNETGNSLPKAVSIII